MKTPAKPQAVNGPLAFEDVGGGFPLVLLHAFPLNATMWAPQLPALMNGCRCLAPDLRGFGASPVAGPHTMDQYADDVAAMLDALGIERAVIAGLSMGGYVALALWRRHRERIRALVLADTRATPDSPEAAAKRVELMAVAREGGAAAVAERQIVALLGTTTRAKHPEIEEDVRGLILRAPVEGIVGALDAIMHRADSTPLLPTIDVPTLIVVGAEDTITTPAESQAMHAAIAGSRIEIIEGAGHLSNLERPAAFNTVVSEFVGGLLYH
jgi:3-oxoadipate enol-lactonase